MGCRENVFKANFMRNLKVQENTENLSSVAETRLKVGAQGSTVPHTSCFLKHLTMKAIRL